MLRALSRTHRRRRPGGWTATRAASVVVSALAIAGVSLLLLRPEHTVVTAADRFETTPANLFERPPLSDEITFATPADAARRREQLRRLVFGREDLPQRLPSVEPDIEYDAFTDHLENLERVDRLIIALPHGFTSVAYHVIPRRANRELLIYHTGHKEDFLDGKVAVRHFLEQGYAVLVLTMPFEGLNTNPDVLETQCGRVELAPTGHAAYDPAAGNITDHDLLACLPRPLRYFVEPVTVALNHAGRRGYERTAMVGFSGGGWTTVLYAALDARVGRSYSVSGSMPIHVLARACSGDTPESVPSCFGDFEQRMPELYRIANYVELYALGGWGLGRKHVTINNVRDPVSFSGTVYEEWRPRVQSVLRRLGAGEYDAVGDITHSGHIISAFALSVIESDLEGG